LREIGWPGHIVNAAYHSGLLILTERFQTSLWRLDFAVDIPVRLSDFKTPYSTALAINGDYYCFADTKQICVFSRKFYSKVANLLGGNLGSVVDITISGERILALTKWYGIYEWDLSANPPVCPNILSLEPINVSYIRQRRRVGIEGCYEDVLGWERRKRVLLNFNTKDFIIEGYENLSWYNSNGKEFKTTVTGSENKMSSLDMVGNFLVQATIEQEPTFLIQDAKTSETVKDLTHLPKHYASLGDFLGATFNPRQIIFLYTSGIYVISKVISERIKDLTDDLFSQASCSRMLRIRTRNWPEKGYYGSIYN
jgi:hypothetical protein